MITVCSAYVVHDKGKHENVMKSQSAEHREDASNGAQDRCIGLLTLRLPRLALLVACLSPKQLLHGIQRIFWVDPNACLAVNT